MPDSRQHAINRPPIGQSSLNCASVAAEMRCPIRKDHRQSVVRKRNVAASISGLFWFCRPAAIFRAVSRVIVDSLNRMFGAWSRPHVCEKVDESHLSTPAVANSNSPAMIVLRPLGLWAATTLAHRAPNGMLRSLVKAVSCVSTSGRFTEQAAAAFCASTLKAFGENLFRPSACTFAKAVRSSAFWPINEYHFLNRQPAELLAS